MGVISLKCIRHAYATLLAIPIVLGMLLFAVPGKTSAVAATIPCSWKINPLYMDNVRLLTGMDFTNPTLQAAIFTIDHVQSGYIANSTGDYLLIVYPTVPGTDVSTLVQTFVSRDTNPNWAVGWRNVSGSGSTTMYRLIKLDSNYQPVSSGANAYTATSTKIVGRISCLSAVKNIASNGSPNGNSPFSLATDISAVPAAWPVATPEVAWAGTTFEPQPEPPVVTVPGDEITNVYAGDLTKEYVHQLALKIIAGAIAALLGYFTIIQFRWRGND